MEHTIVKSSTQGYLIRFEDPHTGKAKQLRAYSRTPISKQTKAGARKRAPEVIDRYLKRAVVKKAIEVGKAVTISEFFAEANRDPGSRSKISEAHREKRRHCLEVFRLWLEDQGLHGKKPISEITRPVMLRYLGDRLAGGLRTPSGRPSRPCKPYSIRTADIMTISRAFNYLLDNELVEGISRNPCRKLFGGGHSTIEQQKLDRRDRSMDDESLELLLENCTGTFMRDNRGAEQVTQMAPCWMHAALTLISKTGMRPGEAREARWDDIDWKKGILQVRKGKTGARQVILIPELLEYLKGVQENRREVGIKSELILCYEDGRRVTKDSMCQAFNRYKTRLGLGKGVTLYGLRHRFAHKLSDQLQLPDVMSAMGHQDVRTTTLYTTKTVESVRKKVVNLEL